MPYSDLQFLEGKAPIPHQLGCSKWFHKGPVDIDSIKKVFLENREKESQTFKSSIEYRSASNISSQICSAPTVLSIGAP